MKFKKVVNKSIAVAISGVMLASPILNMAHANEISMPTRNTYTENDIQEIMESIEYKASPENPYIRICEVVDEKGVPHIITVNDMTGEMTIDNELVEITREVIEVKERTLIDYSTAITATGKIPWKGSVILLSAAIGGLVSGGAAAGWAATIAGALTADAENIYVKWTQYSSKESYFSTYHNTYYKKAINRNIYFRQSSPSGKILLGPVHGSWYDPIRPA